MGVEKYFQEQEERIDRLMKIINADDPYRLIGVNLTFYDIIIFTCQCMWHLKDWICNDGQFMAKDIQRLMGDIHAEKCLLICGDLANGSKHLNLTSPKTEFSFFEAMGLHIDTMSGIHQKKYYIVSPDANDPYHGMEIRSLLNECRMAWSRIIDAHHLSNL